MYKIDKFISGIGCLTILLFTACNNTETKKENFIDPITSNIDSSFSPQDDFFDFANNSWFKAHPIPATESSNGIVLTIQDKINEDLKTICETTSKSTTNKKGSIEQKIGDFYFSGMDTLTIEKAGISGLQKEFAAIDKIKTIPDILSSVAHLQSIGVSNLFTFDVVVDEKNTSKYVSAIWQGRLGLPEREYYFSSDSRIKNIRIEYIKHLSAIFELTGTDKLNADKKANTIMAMETSIAKASRKMEDLRDPYKNYNKMTLASVSKLSSSINWVEMMQLLGVKNSDSIIVGQPEYLTSLGKILKQYSIDDWKTYLHCSVIENFSPFLDKKFSKENFHFYSTILQGVTVQNPRWKKMVQITHVYLGELIGQKYVAEYTPKGTKEKLLEIAKNIQSVYADRIKNLDWMSQETKDKALSKLNKINMKMGYPDKWKDMSSVDISRNNYLQNIININSWFYSIMINKSGKDVDRTEWGLYPHTYNAYYDPSTNEICVPACNIIVPGFEGRMPDDAVLYAVIGASTMGHELTHGFDDQGSLYDENGKLNDWWTKEDRTKFVSKTKLIVDQFSNYTALDSMHLNGINTQGENIADLGGVIMGLEAFKKTQQGKSKELIDGYTPEQRYFLSYAYAFMTHDKDELLAELIMSDEHSPARYRVLGPLSNNEDFYKAFNVTPGNKMYRADSLRVKIW